MHLSPLSADGIKEVLSKLRAADRREVEATNWSFDPERLTQQIVACAAHGFLAGAEDGEPIAFFAAAEPWPHVLQFALLATDRFDEIGKKLTRYLLKETMPVILASGAHRAEARSIAGHRAAHSWLKFLGAKEEAILRAYGKGGEDFHVFTWLAPAAAEKASRR